eukprot:5469710-Alexandrium_andersonii.AAC.1
MSLLGSSVGRASPSLLRSAISISHRRLRASVALDLHNEPGSFEVAVTAQPGLNVRPLNSYLGK